MTRHAKKFGLGGIAAAALFAFQGSAFATVISGPPLTVSDTNWTVTGLGFKALEKSTLNGFFFQNQGKADTVVLTDASGNVLHSLNTPAGEPSYAASVRWNLHAGDTYWLLQTVASNDLFATYGASLPSNDDIAIIQSGVFAFSIASAVTGNNFPNNLYWVAFNNIAFNEHQHDFTIATTSGVPELPTWAVMALGFGGLAATRLFRWRRA
jgi:hypothetical protein